MGFLSERLDFDRFQLLRVHLKLRLIFQRRGTASASEKKIKFKNSVDEEVL